MKEMREMLVAVLIKLHTFLSIVIKTEVKLTKSMCMVNKWINTDWNFPFPMNEIPSPTPPTPSQIQFKINVIEMQDY